MVEELDRTELIHFATTDISRLPHTSGFNVKLKTPINESLDEFHKFSMYKSDV